MLVPNNSSWKVARRAWPLLYCCRFRVTGLGFGFSRPLRSAFLRDRALPELEEEAEQLVLRGSGLAAGPGPLARLGGASPEAADDEVRMAPPPAAGPAKAGPAAEVPQNIKHKWQSWVALSNAANSDRHRKISPVRPLRSS